MAYWYQIDVNRISCDVGKLDSFFRFSFICVNYSYPAGAREGDVAGYWLTIPLIFRFFRKDSNMLQEGLAVVVFRQLNVGFP